MHVFKRKYSQIEILIGAAFFSLSFYCNSQNSNRDTKVIRQKRQTRFTSIESQKECELSELGVRKEGGAAVRGGCGGQRTGNLNSRKNAEKRLPATRNYICFSIIHMYIRMHVYLCLCTCIIYRLSAAILY